MVIYPEEICYLQVTPEDVPEIISQTIKEKKVIDRLLYVDPTQTKKKTMNPIYPSIRIKNETLSAIIFKIDSQAASMTIWHRVVILPWSRAFQG